MSVQRYRTGDGTRWRVRWRETNGRLRSRTVATKTEALALDADIRARKYRGDTLPRTGRQTLASAYDEWWRLRASMLSKNTQRTYRSAWNAHVKDRFDWHRLDELAADPQLVEELLADMRARSVGPAAQRKALAVMSAVLTACVEWRKIASNPVVHVRKPPGTRQRLSRPFPPLVVEQIREEMLRRPTTDPTRMRQRRDAVLVSLLAYAGLRPGEALALTFGDIGTRSLSIDKAVAEKEEKETKTRATRVVPLVAALRSDLAEWRTLRGSPPDGELVLPAADGSHWSGSDLRNWRRRVWKPVMEELAGADAALAHLATARPYDCRGSFVSLHLRAGASPLEVAAWAGPSAQVLFRHYASVIEELVGEPALSADEQIARARATVSSRRGDEVTELVVDLLAHPTRRSAAREGSEAWRVLYDPEGPTEIEVQDAPVIDVSRTKPPRD